MSQLKNIFGNLDSEWNRLNAQWADTSAKWRDYNCLKFKRDYFDLYQQTLNLHLKELDNLNRLIDRAKQEVK